jgi:hypothetical protein
MKKSTPKRAPHKLVLRGEAIAVLTPTQLGQIVGASVLSACSHQSNQNMAPCVPPDTDK